jgi:hypothetical protein
MYMGVAVSGYSSAFLRRGSEASEMVDCFYQKAQLDNLGEPHPDFRYSG